MATDEGRYAANKEHYFEERFGASAQGNFAVIDTIGVPHAYCIGPKHVAYASAHTSGILNNDAIERAEKYAGAKCCTCRGDLPYAEHKQALLVRCKIDTSQHSEVAPELKEYLLSIVDKAQQDGYEGFAFVMAR